MGESTIQPPDRELRAIVEAMPAAAVRCNKDQRFLWVNQRYAEWVGRPAGMVVGRGLGEIIGAEALAQIRPHIEKVLAGEPVQYERLANFQGIGERWVSWTYTPTADGWIAVGIDVHDRRVAEDALRKEHQQRDEFLAALAHELRNPLAPIRNAVAILEKKGPLDPEVAWSRAVIERQIEQLSRLIGDLVDIERIARGRLELRRERVLLEAVVDMALESSRSQVNAGGHRLSVLLPSEPAVLDADPARLAQALATLIKNAARHTPAKGTITLGAAVEGGEAVVSVEDSGVGLQAEAATRLFTEGAGVGLRLVSGIVRLHEGRIEARSAGANRGTEVTMRLPLARGGAPAQPATEYRPKGGPARPVRVLVADDNRDAADTLRRVLALHGHEVRVAYDGVSAMRIGQEFRPRVAVLDIAMPGGDGYDVARAMRKAHGADVTLVAVTGWGQEADRARALQSGFDYHLVKPVDPGLLNDLLAEVASKQ